MVQNHLLLKLEVFLLVLVVFLDFHQNEVISVESVLNQRELFKHEVEAAHDHVVVDEDDELRLLQQVPLDGLRPTDGVEDVDLNLLVVDDTAEAVEGREIAVRARVLQIVQQQLRYRAFSY